MCRVYVDQFEFLLTNKTSIASYLEKQLEVHNEQVFDLKDRLLGLQQAKDQQKNILDKSLENSKDKCRSETERWEKENLFLCKKRTSSPMIEWRSSRLTALNDFKQQRAGLQTTIDELKESIEEKQKTHHKALGQLQIGLIRFKETIEERSHRLSQRVSEGIPSTSNQSDLQDNSTSHSRELSSHRTIGRINRNQAQSLGRQRWSHPHCGDSRRSASPISEETSHDRTPSSPNLIESSWTDAEECRRTPKSTERNSVGQRREEDSSEQLVYVSVDRREWSSRRHYRSSSDLHRSFHSDAVLLTASWILWLTDSSRGRETFSRQTLVIVSHAIRETRRLKGHIG